MDIRIGIHIGDIIIRRGNVFETASTFHQQRLEGIAKPQGHFDFQRIHQQQVPDKVTAETSSMFQQSRT